jgi:hypothetical protein
MCRKSPPGSTYLKASAICSRQHFPDISAPVTVPALKNHQAQSSFLHKAWSFESSGLFEANNNGHITSRITSPYRESKTPFVNFLSLLSSGSSPQIHLSGRHEGELH